jgi:glycine/D-amino acid oxidase-like deaminating enzyme
VLLSAGDIGPRTEYTATVDWSMLEEAVRKAVNRIPVLESAQIRHAWAGPAGPSPRRARHHRLGARVRGYSSRWASAARLPALVRDRMMTAEWLLDGKPSLDLSDLSISRFGG